MPFTIAFVSRLLGSVEIGINLAPDGIVLRDGNEGNWARWGDGASEVRRTFSLLRVLSTIETSRFWMCNGKMRCFESFLDGGEVVVFEGNDVARLRVSLWKTTRH